MGLILSGIATAKKWEAINFDSRSRRIGPASGCCVWGGKILTEKMCAKKTCWIPIFLRGKNPATSWNSTSECNSEEICRTTVKVRCTVVWHLRKLPEEPSATGRKLCAISGLIEKCAYCSSEAKLVRARWRWG